MTTKKTAAAAEKAVPKPAPFELEPKPAAPSAMFKLPRPIMSSDTQPKLDPPNLTPPRRGPQTGMSSMSDGDFVSQYASSEELASFRATVEQRRARDAATWEFWRCSNPRCRTVLKDKPGGTESPCPRCNWLRRVDGGHLRRMSAAEVDEHLYQQANKDQAEENQMRRAAFYERNAERAKAGLPPLTFEAFTAQARAEFEQLKQRGRDLGQVAAAFRRLP